MIEIALVEDNPNDRDNLIKALDDSLRKKMNLFI